MSHETYKAVTQAQFRKMAKGFASAKDNLQVAIGAAVYQAIILDNPNWLNELYEMAEFWQSPVDGKYRVSRDGRLVYAYLSEGCGLTSEIIKLDRESKAWKLQKGRKLAIEEIDQDVLWNTLDTVRFDKWAAPKKETTAFNPALVLSRAQKRLTVSIEENTLDVDAIQSALEVIESIRKQLINAKKISVVTPKPDTDAELIEELSRLAA